MKAAGWLVTGLLIAGTARAGDREFKDVVAAISEEFQTKPTHIPMLWLAKGIVAAAHPVGTKQLDLAIFEDLDESRGSGRDLADSVRRAVGHWVQPMVVDHEMRNGQNQTVLVYMFEKGKDVNVLTVVVEKDEAIVTEVRLNPEALQKWESSSHANVKFWGDTVTKARGERDDDSDK